MVLADCTFRPLLRDFATTSAANCFIRDYPLVSTAGKKASFVIVAMDALGRRRISGGDEFTVQFLSGGDAKEVKEEVKADIKDNGHGTYVVTYTVASDSPRWVSVTHCSMHINRSPFPYPFRCQGTQIGEMQPADISHSFTAGPDSCIYVLSLPRHDCSRDHDLLLTVFTVDGSIKRQLQLQGSHTKFMDGLAVSSDGRVLVRSQDRVVVYSADGFRFQYLTSNGLLTADTTPFSLTFSDNTGVFVSECSVSGLATYMASDQIVVCDSTACVHVFNSAAVPVRRFKLDSGDVDAISSHTIFGHSQIALYNSWSRLLYVFDQNGRQQSSKQIRIRCDRYGPCIAFGFDCVYVSLYGQSRVAILDTTLNQLGEFEHVFPDRIAATTDGTVCVEHVTEHKILCFR